MLRRLLQPLLPSKETPYVGLDISATSVKLLCLSKDHLHNYQITAYAALPLPEGAVVDKEIKDIDVVAATIKKAHSQSHAPTKYAAIALADSSVIMKTIRLDKGLSELEVEELVMLEADKHIPYPLDEIYLDYQILGGTKDEPNSVDVLIAASRAKTVDSYAQALNNAGLTPRIVDVESYAERKACYLFKDELPNEGKDRTIAVVDIGSNRISLTILHDFMPIFTRTELLGGNRLIKIIANRYDLTPKEAEEGMIKNTLPDDYKATILPKFEEDIVQHINRALQFYSSASTADTVDHIALVGGNALLPGLSSLIIKQLNIPTAVANPIAHMTLHPRINKEDLKYSSSRLMICCGLALRSFD